MTFVISTALYSALAPFVVWPVRPVSASTTDDFRVCHTSYDAFHAVLFCEHVARHIIFSNLEPREIYCSPRFTRNILFTSVLNSLANYNKTYVN